MVWVRAEKIVHYILFVLVAWDKEKDLPLETYSHTPPWVGACLGSLG